jgi:uncharacterized membrane protein
MAMLSPVLFRAREYLKGSLWIYPLLGAILGPLVAWVTEQADVSLTVPPAWQYAPSTASTVLTTIVGATVGLTGFVVTVTVLAIQMATGTFSARYMRIWYRDPLLKATLSVLVGTLAFSFSLLRQVGTKTVPNIGISVAGFLLVFSLVLFLLFFDRFIHRLRPVAVAALVARMAERIIKRILPKVEAGDGRELTADGDAALTVLSKRAGSIQAVNVGGLVAWAAKHDVVVVMHAAIGDFLSNGQPLLTVYGARRPSARADRYLQGMISLGMEARSRTTLPSLCGSSSTSPSRPCLPPSTTPPRRSRLWTTWGTCCACSAPCNCMQSSPSRIGAEQPGSTCAGEPGRIT